MRRRMTGRPADSRASAVSSAGEHFACAFEVYEVAVGGVGARVGEGFGGDGDYSLAVLAEAFAYELLCPESE